MTGTLSDVTARKNAEIELVKSQENLKRIIENSSELICEVDSGGRYTFVSGRYKDVLGYDTDELLGSYAAEKLHPDDLTAAREKYNELTAKKGISVDVWRFKHKNGSYRYFECRGSTYTDSQESLKTVVISHDITELKTLEDTQLFLALGGTLYLESDFFKSLARFLSKILGVEHIFIDRLSEDKLSAETLVIYSDGGFIGNIRYELKGTPCADVVGKPSCIYKDSVLKHFPDDKMLADLKGEGYAGVTLWNSEGKPFGLIAAVSRREIDDVHRIETVLKIAGFRAAAEIERRDAEERIKKLLREKEILLKEVHHRIKNNMSSVKGLLLLQADSVNNASTVSALKDAVSRIDSMMVLYDRLYRSDNLKEISTKDYLPALLNEILSNFPARVKISTSIRVDEFMINVSILVPLGIIITELVTNIMKYAFIGRESGLIDFSVTVNGKRAVMTIEDNGLGLPESFDIKNSNGFGMQLVSMLSEQIGGDLSVESGNGTRVTLGFTV